MTVEQALAGIQAASADLKKFLPFVSIVAPGPAAMIGSGADVVGAAAAVIEKLQADASADTTQEDANLAAANASMIANAKALDQIADS